MYYFLGYRMLDYNTGVEKAQYNRQKLFKKYGIESQIVYTFFNHYTNYYAINYGLTEHDYINMYNDFQEANDIYLNIDRDWINEWRSLGYEVKISENPLNTFIYFEGRLLFFARFVDKSYKKIIYQNHFDKSKKLIMRDKFDNRGFLSTRQFIDNNIVIQDEIYTLSGKKVIERYFNEKTKSTIPSLIILHYKNETFFFNHERELTTFYYNLLLKDGDTVIIDRSLEQTLSVVNCKPKITKNVFLHSIHLRDFTGKDTTTLTAAYKDIFSHLHKFDNVIVSTEQQRRDLERQYEYDSFKNIPVGYVPDHSQEDKRTLVENIHEKINKIYSGEKIKVVSLARYAGEKNLTDQIDIVCLLKEHFPNIEFHLYGFGSEKDRLKEYVINKNADEYIYINDYASNITEVYKDAAFSMNTSYREGFSLSILESLSYGVPVFAYDINYGPKEMIFTRKNGALVIKQDKQSLYEEIIYMLSSKTIYESYCLNSLKYSELYSEQNILDKWKKL